ncbi:IS110 family transposase [Streptomyces sp. NBC_01637]|uniref:IS110 family transposase n=1 Tax=unclassified Streptomyces TaxID=2593676 RepID=UPI00386446B5|nr:IS110 family transposase [Streptomyces sp. NBC_01653]WTC84577.1 IS110 family transposase [Streptomyces sp. NBC_01653]WTD86290.1 IS110 family transposase [Streptomyces sp. NBC_01637]WTD94234.1 IS110 family transposase [Streptomyces sp. NBC_01637]
MEIVGLPTPVFCGVDWAEGHHDIALVEAGGKQLAKVRISDDAAGFAQLTALLTEHGDSEDAPIPVAIETSRGLLVACLRATGRPVFAINPLAVARYRDRHSVARKKSDAVDAAALANILRTDMAAHRPLPADSELVQAIAVLARAQQDAVWARGQAQNKLRSQLREFYPAILDAYAQHKHGLCSREARSILAAAPTPTMAAKLTRRRLQSLLKQAGRVRGIQTEAERLHEVFKREYLHQLPQVETALGHQTSALLRQLNTACDNAEQLEEAVTQAFAEHHDAPIIRSFPGLASLTGARILAEIGDDRTRFANAGSLKAYAGSAPVTRSSGKSCMVMSRRIKNQRLAAVGYVWAFVSLTRSPGARAHYDRRREAGDRHVAAQRNLFNRFMGMLFYCLQNAHIYDEAIAFPQPSPELAAAAA